MMRVTVIVLIIAVMAGCGPKVSKEIPAGCVPKDMRVVPNSGMMTVIWKTDCRRLIGGYNIYISEEPLGEAYPGQELPPSVAPFNRTPFPGDTTPDDGEEHFVAEGLTDGVKYYVTVRTVFPDRSLSKPSEEIVISCGARGEIELPIRYRSDNDGFSFARNDYVSATDLANDLCFFSKDGVDYLMSPSRLDGFLRQNRLALVKFKGELDIIKAKVAALGSAPAEERVAVRKGDWVHIRTNDDRNALVQVLDVSGQGGERRIKLFVAYSSVPGEFVL
jgi:hypothetical protein